MALIGADNRRAHGGKLITNCVTRADARRIVAAVNACAGISTDELERLVRADKRLDMASPIPYRLARNP